ncbi:hypothetical protein HYT26_04985 [Candidatus Pacearchaeota archaeon]|nr:hypothetical protein [Candidatus Pacearchaeota archaeon]
MATFELGELTAKIGPALVQMLGLLWGILKLLGIVGFLLLIWWYTSYNVRLLERKFTKGGRVSISLKRAKKIFDKKLGHPQIQTFGFFGFGSKKLNEPPSDCIFPYQSSFGNSILYDYIIKEGIYYPISNVVLGRKYIVSSDIQLQQDDKFMQWAQENGIEIKSIGNPENIVYSIEGSGLEITRDFEAEQASLNNLINAADKYKNRKPIEIAAMYGLMIIIVVGAFITLIYAFYKSGQIIDAVNKGWEIFKDLGGKVVEQKLGPG